jgi:hypothetical protein
MDVKVLQPGIKELGPTPLGNCCMGSEHSCEAG